MPAVNALASLTDERVGSGSPPTVSNGETKERGAAARRSIASQHRLFSSGSSVKPATIE